MILVDMNMPESCYKCPFLDVLSQICPLMPGIPAWQKDISKDGQYKRTEHCPLIEYVEEQMKKEVTVNMSCQLQDRTVNIMMIAKRFPISRMKSEIARYMSEECGTPVECYTDTILYSIIKNAFFDWLQCGDKERTMAAIHRYFECVDEGHSTTECMLIALGSSQVAEITEDGQRYYICGFHDTDFSRKLDKMWKQDNATLYTVLPQI